MLLLNRGGLNEQWLSDERNVQLSEKKWSWGGCNVARDIMIMIVMGIETMGVVIVTTGQLKWTGRY